MEALTKDILNMKMESQKGKDIVTMGTNKVLKGKEIPNKDSEAGESSNVSQIHN